MARPLASLSLFMAVFLWIFEAFTASLCRRKVQLRERLLADVWPPGSDHLLLGVEPHALGTMHVVVAEERVLPASEGVEGHRDWNRHVDADHAHVDFPLEGSCHFT